MPGSPKKRARRLALREAAAQPPYLPAMNLSPAGGPPAYDPRFCEVVLEDAARGHTLGGTAGLIGVSAETIAEWRTRFPQFNDAATRAGPIRQRFYEAHLIDIVRRGGDSMRFCAIRFALVNLAADDWRDKPAAEASVTFDLGALIRRPSELARPIFEGEAGEQTQAGLTGQ